MLIPLLLVTALTQRAQHQSVQQGSQPIVMSRDVPQRAEAAKLDVFAYCDVSGQPTIMVTNIGPSLFTADWTLTAVKPPSPPDFWSGVSHLEPGQFEGWMSPAQYLHLEISFDYGGQTTTKAIDAFCPVMNGFSGLEDDSGR